MTLFGCMDKIKFYKRITETADIGTNFSWIFSTMRTIERERDRFCILAFFSSEMWFIVRHYSKQSKHREEQNKAMTKAKITKPYHRTS